MMCVVLCFSFLFYLPRSRSPRCLALTPSPFDFFRLSHRIMICGVNVGMYIVAASHSHV